MLKEFVFEECLNFIVVFWLFCLMVGLGMLMLLLGVLVLWLCCGDWLYYLWLFLCFVLWMGLFGLIVIFVGWVIIEVGC